MNIKIIHDKSSGLTWAVELVINHGAPTVKFYDCRYEHTDLGQFVSSYYAMTLLCRDDGLGLSLDGGIPEWSISGPAMDRVKVWLKDVLMRKGE